MAFLANQRLRKKERFSLLLLEPGEIYFEDFSAYLYLLKVSNVVQKGGELGWTKGRLKICSKSIIFDPVDFSMPILKFLFRDGVKIIKGTENDLKLCDLLFECDTSSSHLMLINTKQFIEMKQNNHVTPYKFFDVDRWYMCVLQYRFTEDFLPMVEQLQRASTLPATDQLVMVNAIVAHKQQLLKFNPMWIENSVEEQQVLECFCSKVAPLVTNPGRLVLTNVNLYYQPFNNIDPEPFQKVKLKQISSVLKRRYLLQQIGLEIFFRSPSLISYLYLTFESPDLRDEAYNKLISQPLVECDDLEQENMTLKWRNRAVSNYDYLTYLNTMAQRSMNDLTQYPVFPWVIQDYSSQSLDLDNPKTFRDLSKPIGALNPERLDKLKIRYAEMQDEPRFLYGSHYSSPGYVLFYLVRTAPEYMLCLQNGRFDQPDRMFNSVSEAWNNCLNSYSDYKELIPEFYHGDGEFLINLKKIDFGLRHDGNKIGDVILPPWAKDPSDFIYKMRATLECDHVSNRLHQWIDLIFGYKSHGEAAENSYNLFYYLTYEGAVNLNSLKDMNERMALEQQILEFGQTPHQLFTNPHSPRSSPLDIALTEVLVLSSCTCEPSVGVDQIEGVTALWVDHSPHTEGLSVDRQIVTGPVYCPHTPRTPKGRVVWSEASSLEVISSHELHKAEVTDLLYGSDSNMVYSIAADGFLKVYNWLLSAAILGPKVSQMALSCCVFLEEPDVLLIGCLDNCLYLFSSTSGLVLDTWQLHDDALSCVWFSADLMTLITASWDSTVRLYSISKNMGKYRYHSKFETDNETGVTCISVRRDAKSVFVGLKDGSVMMWSPGQNTHSMEVFKHKDSVTDIQLSQDEQRLLSSSEDCSLALIDLTDCSVILEHQLPGIARCMQWLSEVIIIGADNGCVQLWRIGPCGLELQCTLQVHNDAVTCLHASGNGRITTGGKDKKVNLLKAVRNPKRVALMFPDASD